MEMCVPAPCREHVDVFPHGAGLLLPLLSFPCGGGMPCCASGSSRIISKHHLPTYLWKKYKFCFGHVIFVSSRCYSGLGVLLDWFDSLRSIVILCKLI